MTVESPTPPSTGTKEFYILTSIVIFGVVIVVIFTVVIVVFCFSSIIHLVGITFGLFMIVRIISRLLP